jgi:hypothetical protein
MPEPSGPDDAGGLLVLAARTLLVAVGHLHTLVACEATRRTPAKCRNSTFVASADKLVARTPDAYPEDLADALRPWACVLDRWQGSGDIRFALAHLVASSRNLCMPLLTLGPL